MSSRCPMLKIFLSFSVNYVPSLCIRQSGRRAGLHIVDPILHRPRSILLPRGTGLPYCLVPLYLAWALGSSSDSRARSCRSISSTIS